LPIQNGAIWTACRGPSSSPRFSSVMGLPILNVPPGIGSISNVTAVPGMVSTYGVIDRAGSSGCRGGADRVVGLVPAARTQRAARLIVREERIM
jgi:hypothetical protein